MLTAIAGRTDGPRGGPSDITARGARPPDAAVAEIAQQMWIPEGLFRALIERYPELSRALAHRYRGPTCTA